MRAYIGDRADKVMPRSIRGMQAFGREATGVTALEWTKCPLVEVIPGKVSGAPLLKGTRLPVDALIENYDSFRDEGLAPDAAIAETLDCYPEVGLEAIQALLAHRAKFSLLPRP